jgi:hypothetical protein
MKVGVASDDEKIGERIYSLALNALSQGEITVQLREGTPGFELP